MGYRADGRLEHFGRPDALLEAQRRTVERTASLLADLTREHTPVAKPPPGHEAEWLESRHGRLPGSLKESWRVGMLEMVEDGRLMRMEVYTNDPVAPYVEWPTQAHVIWSKPGHVLRFWDKLGRTVFATLVHHPGTGGSFMLTTAVAEVALLWVRIGVEELQRWVHDQAAAIHA